MKSARYLPIPITHDIEKSPQLVTVATDAVLAAVQLALERAHPILASLQRPLIGGSPSWLGDYGTQYVYGLYVDDYTYAWSNVNGSGEPTLYNVTMKNGSTLLSSAEAIDNGDSDNYFIFYNTH